MERRRARPEGVRASATSPRTRRSTRSERRRARSTARRDLPLRRPAGALRRRPRGRGGPVRRRRGALGLGQDDAAARDHRNRDAQRRDGRPARRSARRLRAAGRDGQLELSGHRRRVRDDGSLAGAACCRGRAPRSAPRSRRSSPGWGSRGSPSATSASSRAASSSGCSSRAPCSAAPSCCCSTSPPPGVDVRLRHEVLHLLDDLNAAGRGDRAHHPRPQRHRRAPAAAGLPQPRGDRRRAPARGAHARGARTHLRSQHAGARARRHAGGRRLLPEPRAAVTGGPVP